MKSSRKSESISYLDDVAAAMKQINKFLVESGFKYEEEQLEPRLHHTKS